MKVLVTGASGFVGRRVCSALLAAGHQVVAPVRSGIARAAMPEGVMVEAVVDPLSVPVLTPLVAGAEAVIHLAARVHVMAETASDPLSEFRRINVDGTRAVTVAARAAGARQVVYVSSIKVNGEGREQPYSEADAPRPMDPYGQSKLDAENVIRALDAGLSWTIVRPPLVYGPGVGGNFRRLLQLAGMAARWPLPLGGIDNLRSMIFVDNLADALVTTITHPAARQRTFLVSDDHDVSVSELLRRLAMALGGRSRLFRAPVTLLQQAGSLLGRQADLDRVFGTLRLDTRLIQSTLGWRAPVELGDGLVRTADWWRHVVTE
jgi:nucleoside-diphosphate-sugar epimerase